MKKTFVIVLGIIIAAFIYFGEKRSFYKLGADISITVWKTYGGTCYIIPRKYFGILKPFNNYIKTSNVSIVHLYTTTSLPATIIVLSEGKSKIHEGNNAKYKIIDYNQNESKMDSLLYQSSSERDPKLYANVNLLVLFLKENFAEDENRKIYE